MSEIALELIQTLTIVFDPKGDWSFETLFGKASIVSCPLATQSLVYIQSSEQDLSFDLSPEPSTRSPSLSVYDLKKLKSLSLSVSPRKNSHSGDSKQHPQLIAQRYFTGHGHEFGGIAVHLRNNGNRSLDITYFEMIPWYLRLYFHTLHLEVNGTEVTLAEAFKTYRFTPAQDRSSPALFEFSVQLPPQSLTSFTIQFEKAFLHWTEHPPDAHRGFDIGSAVVTGWFHSEHKDLQLNGLEWSPLLYSRSPTAESQSFRIYTEGLLVSLPTPDFSMPYNVITMTGTVFALFFGSIFTALARKMKNADLSHHGFVSGRPIPRLIRWLLKFIDNE